MKHIYRLIRPAVLLLLFLLYIDASAMWDYKISVTTLDNPSPGYIFIAPVADDSIKILDNSGNQVFIRQFLMPPGGQSDIKYTNLNLWPNGWLSFYVNKSRMFYLIDENLNLVDSIQSMNGAESDGHDLRLLPNGHYLIIGVRYTNYDLSKIFHSGQSEAKIMDNIIQELDKNKNVIFEWQASDHFYVGDVIDTMDIFGLLTDPFHMNSVDVDTDGNFLISCRHTDEITKISRATGNIIWRMGGTKCKNNQFTFVGDSTDNFVGFSHQHDARWLPNGNLILFDNGNLKDSLYSRAVEYKIDEINKIATKVWEYRNTPDVYTSYMGNVQRLPNGNTLIGWGGSYLFSGEYSDSYSTSVTEVKSDGTKVFEMSMKGNASYHAYRYIYQMAAVTKEINGKGSYEFNESSKNQTALTISIDNLSGTGKLTTELHYYAPLNASFTDTEPCGIFGYRWVVSKEGLSNASGILKFHISSLPKLYTAENIRVYRRDSEGTGEFKYVTTKYNSSTNEIEATTTCTGEFIMCMNELIRPILKQPLDNSTNIPNKLVVNWEKNNNGTNSYRIQLSDNKTFNTIKADQILYDLDNFEFTDLEYNKDYYWRVKAQNNNCESRWTDALHFSTTLRIPTLDLPKTGSVNPIDGTISWFSVEGAKKYKVQIARNQDFDSTAIVLDRTLTGLWLQYSGLQYNLDYYWRVKASNDIAESEWSIVSKFTTILTSPQNVSPLNEAMGIPVNGILTWNKVTGAELYKVEIDTSIEFSRPVVSESGIVNDTFKYSGLKNNTIYYWHIKAVNQYSKSDWSITYKFTTIHPPPFLSVPLNNATKIPVNGSLIWKELLGAKKYGIQISSSPDFISPKYNVAGNTNNIFHYENLDENTKYYWRVNASNDNGTSVWSEVWTFFTKLKSILATPVLVAPTDYYIRLSGSEKLIWDPVQGATNYWLQISTNPEFSELIVDDEKLINPNYPLNNLKYDSKYYWRVAAVNSETTSDWSETWTFLTIIAMPSLVSPANYSIDIPISGILNWNKVEGAVTYKVQLSDDTKFNNLIFEKDNINDLFSNYPDLSYNKQYWWRVNAKNANSESDWSEIWNFRTLNPSGFEDNLKNPASIKISYYPNPCISKLSVDIELLISDNTSIIIYDELGIERAKLYDDYLQSGHYHFEWNTENVENGAYFCHYVAGSHIEIAKIIINR
jgi:hypothetical protein